MLTIAHLDIAVRPSHISIGKHGEAKFPRCFTHARVIFYFRIDAFPFQGDG
jgi:hypothetical protein